MDADALIEEIEKLPPNQKRKVREHLDGAPSEGAYRSDAAAAGLSAFELAEQSGIVGVAQDLPTDLARNKKHLDGFGK